ncbi:DUF6084 family protein [Haloactinomyces albus]|uniref:Uncharacterized protein n=1 Tax=Haloactinomyces albus TaxID=1352928 RepID=A0AAE3ZBF7_9ACTN|nr:DUF6084 family protein [Haloactinomyces albus]MDR7300044.1 hypothetical protein [Haloactinomyces albus]
MTAGQHHAGPAPAPSGPGGEPSVPELSFTVTGVEPVRFAAVPTLNFGLDISRYGGGPIRSITLTTEVRVAAARRRYDTVQKEMLAELFGQPQQWGTTMRALPWTRTTIVVPPFTDSTVVDLPVACSHDVELAVTKYFHAVRDGDVPLDFLFSGTIFHTGEGGQLRTAQISWSSDTTFSMPGRLWQEVMEQCSPGHSWLRLSGDTFERLYAYKTGHALASWNETVDVLLAQAESDTGAAGRIETE